MRQGDRPKNKPFFWSMNRNPVYRQKKSRFLRLSSVMALCSCLLRVFRNPEQSHKRSRFFDLSTSETA
jgi:hypothetical protein